MNTNILLLSIFLFSILHHASILLLLWHSCGSVTTSRWQLRLDGHQAFESHVCLHTPGVTTSCVPRLSVGMYPRHYVTLHMTSPFDVTNNSQWSLHFMNIHTAMNIHHITSPLFDQSMAVLERQMFFVAMVTDSIDLDMIRSQRSIAGKSPRMHQSVRFRIRCYFEIPQRGLSIDNQCQHYDVGCHGDGQCSCHDNAEPPSDQTQACGSWPVCPAHCVQT